MTTYVPFDFYTEAPRIYTAVIDSIRITKTEGQLWPRGDIIRGS